MFDLFQQAQHDPGPLPDLTADRVFHAVSRYLPSEDVDQLRSYVEQGSTVEAPGGAWGPCVQREWVEVPSFELGMERAALLERQSVSGLQANSEAQRAGLREVDRVVGMSISWDDVSKPVKPTVRRGADTSTIMYFPRGHVVGVTPQYVLDQARYHADLHGCQASSNPH